MRAIGLSHCTVRFFDQMPSANHYKAWLNKFNYMQQRLQLGSFRVRKLQNKTSALLNTKCESVQSAKEHALSETLELILKVCGLNQDILNPLRFPAKCNHKQCICVKQPLEVVQQLVNEFTDNPEAVAALLRCAQEAECKIKGLTVDTKPAPHDVIKRFNAVLGRSFNLHIARTSKRYILEHTDGFDDFLRQYEPIQLTPLNCEEVKYDFSD